MNNLFDKYKDEFEERIPSTHKVECHHELVQDDGVNICRLCFSIHPLLVSVQGNNEPSYTAYKRITHIKSNLTRLIGQEEFLLPNSVLSIVKKFNPLTIHQVKKILKSQGLSKYYIHIYSIASRVGLRIPYLSQNEIDRAVYLFNCFNSSYSKVYPNKNCLNYHFLLYKIFQRMGRTDLIPYLNFGTNRTKLLNYEKVWSICYTH
jgi:hypothetical protein